jgi:hypothetical protein
LHLVFLEVDSAWLSLDGWVLGFVAVCFCLVAMSGGVGCAVGAWAGAPLGVSVLGVVAWCLVV